MARHRPHRPDRRQRSAKVQTPWLQTGHRWHYSAPLPVSAAPRRPPPSTTAAAVPAMARREGAAGRSMPPRAAAAWQPGGLHSLIANEAPQFLPLAAASGWETFVRRLLLYGVDVDTAAPPALRSDLNYARHVQDRNTCAFSPLLWACIGPPRSSHPSCIRLLLEARHVCSQHALSRR